ncbi:MAG TPA: hypothetical protein VGK74_08030 [Symbiobacteriaceae bacterium]
MPCRADHSAGQPSIASSQSIASPIPASRPKSSLARPSALLSAQSGEQG